MGGAAARMVGFGNRSADDSGTWTFHVTDIPDSLEWKRFIPSTGKVSAICPTPDETHLLVGTGSGYYLRIGTWQDFDPATWVQTGMTSDTAHAAGSLYTPDGIHFLVGRSSGSVEMRVASTPYDLSTLQVGEYATIHSYFNGDYNFSGASMSEDGKHFIYTNGYIKTSDLATPFDLGTVTNLKSSPVGVVKGTMWVNQSDPRQIIVVQSGYNSSLVGVDTSGLSGYSRFIHLVTMGTAWDATTVESVETKKINFPSDFHVESSLNGVCVNRAGTKMVVTTDSNSAGYAALINLK